jgi:hypothetical protein
MINKSVNQDIGILLGKKIHLKVEKESAVGYELYFN